MSLFLFFYSRRKSISFKFNNKNKIQLFILKVPIKKQTVPSVSKMSTFTSAPFKFDNFRIEQPVNSFKNLPDAQPITFQVKL
jgi:hypothetical protein